MVSPRCRRHGRAPPSLPRASSPSATPVPRARTERPSGARRRLRSSRYDALRVFSAKDTDSTPGGSTCSERGQGRGRARARAQPGRECARPQAAWGGVSAPSRGFFLRASSTPQQDGRSHGRCGLLRIWAPQAWSSRRETRWHGHGGTACSRVLARAAAAARSLPCFLADMIREGGISLVIVKEGHPLHLLGVEEVRDVVARQPPARAGGSDAVGRLAGFTRAARHGRDTQCWRAVRDGANCRHV